MNTATEALLFLVRGAGRPRRLRGTLEFWSQEGLWELEPFRFRQPMPMEAEERQPVTTGQVEVALDGPRLRVAEVGRDPWLISDGVACWTFERDGEASSVPRRGDRFLSRPEGYRDHARPFRASALSHSLYGPFRWFLEGVDADDLAGRDPWEVAGPVVATEGLGRAALTVPGRWNGMSTEVTFARETGQLLDLRTPQNRLHWVDLADDPEFDDDLFRWDGATFSYEDEMQGRDDAQEAGRQCGMQQWSDQVGPVEFTVDCGVPLDLSVGAVEEHDPATGEFLAVLGGDLRIMLQRRRTGVDEPDAQDGSAHSWTTPGFTWTISNLPVRPNAEGRASLQAAFPAE